MKLKTLCFILVSLCSTALLAVELDKNFIVLATSDQQLISYKYSCDKERLMTFKWAVENPGIVQIHSVDSNTVLIKPIAVGDTNLYLISESNPAVNDKCRILINEDGVVKILAIGNSFSEDAIENNLYDLALAENIPTTIANMYIAGCTIERHRQNIDNNSAAYRYREIGEGGIMTETRDKSIDQALKEKKWDFISLQQASGYSGQYATYCEDLAVILSHLKNHTLNSSVKYMIHATWAYAKNSSHAHFAFYNNSQEEMYEAIVNATSRAKYAHKIDLLIPSGTAIQNARSTTIDPYNDLCRDGYHLNETFGRFTAACTWFYTIFGVDVRNNSYKPKNITTQESIISKKAAYTAVSNPFFQTKL